jgi:hypothetical protein
MSQDKKLKYTITYKNAEQISEDSYATFTKVIHLDENMTLKEITKKLGWITGEFDVELHADLKEEL